MNSLRPQLDRLFCALPWLVQPVSSAVIYLFSFISAQLFPSPLSELGSGEIKQQLLCLLTVLYPSRYLQGSWGVWLAGTGAVRALLPRDAHPASPCVCQATLNTNTSGCGFHIGKLLARNRKPGLAGAEGLLWWGRCAGGRMELAEHPGESDRSGTGRAEVALARTVPAGAGEGWGPSRCQSCRETSLL